MDSPPDLDPEAVVSHPPEDDGPSEDEVDVFLGTATPEHAVKTAPITSRALLASLVRNPEFSANLMPLLRDEFFKDPHEQLLFKLVRTFTEKYSKAPSYEAMMLIIERTKCTAETKTKAIEIIKSIASGEALRAATSTAFLMDMAEEWVQERAFYETMLDAMLWTEDPVKHKDMLGTIPQRMQSALDLRIKRKMGVDLIEDATARWDRLHDQCTRLLTDIEILNYVTDGGFKPKKLTVIIAGTGIGKTLALIHLSNAFILNGKNVLYVTLEIEPDEICQRAEARLLDMGTSEIYAMKKELYETKMGDLSIRLGSGKFKVEELTSSVGSARDIKRLLDEYGRMGIKFDALMVDYLGIMAPTANKMDRSNLYAVGKLIAEEVRGLGQQYNLSVFTASQLNRKSLNSNDPGLDGIADSIGIAYAADFSCIVVMDKELQDLRQCKVLVVKNRYRPPMDMPEFVMGVDLVKQKFYDAQSAPGSKTNLVPKPRGSAAVEIKGRGNMATLNFGGDTNFGNGFGGLGGI